MVTTGLGYSYDPGTLPYVRVPVSLEKGDYYLLDRMRAIILSGMGEALGANQTEDQKTAVIEIESMPVDQMEFEIMTHEPRLEVSTTHVAGSLATGTAGTAYDVSVADASVFQAYDTVENLTTGEHYLVLDIDTAASPNTINILPAVNSTGFSGKTTFSATLTPGVAQAKTDGDVLIKVGPAFPEASSAGIVVDNDATSAWNYIQIFRKEFGIGFEAQKVNKKGRQDLEDKDERALTNLIEDMEAAIIRGKIHKSTVSGAPVRKMLGMANTAITNVAAASALPGGGNDITVAKLDYIADVVAPYTKSDKIIGLVSGQFIRKMRSVKDQVTEVNVEVGSDSFGFKAYKYEGGPKPIYLVRHFQYDQRPDQAVFFDPSNFKLRNLEGGELGYVSDKKGLPGATLTDNDQLAFQDAHYGAYSLDYRNEKGTFVLTGISNSIVS